MVDDYQNIINVQANADVDCQTSLDLHLRTLKVDSNESNCERIYDQISELLNNNLSAKNEQYYSNLVNGIYTLFPSFIIHCIPRN